MSDRNLKGVCVGAGCFSRFQSEAWTGIPEVTIVANCNRFLKPAERIAAGFGIAKSYRYDEFAAMLDAGQPDFVDLLTPPATHLPPDCPLHSELSPAS